MTVTTDSTRIKTHLMDITARPRQIFARGQGACLWDESGRRYLDFVQGWAVNTFGHCPALVKEALNRQAALLLSPSPAYFNRPAIELAEQLCAASVFDQVFFANSGAEANEGAIKLARRWGARENRFEIITFQGGFHGRTLACMSASGKPAFEPLFEPKVAGFHKARLNDIASVRGLIGAQTVAIMVEPVQGEAGVLPADPAFMRALRTLADEHNLLLIVDEIQTGVGRTGSLWAYEQSDIRPDIMTLGKGLGAGVPLSALLATERVSCFEHGDQGGTWCGNPLMTAVGSAVMQQVTEPGFLSRVREQGTYLKQRLSALSQRHGLGEVRGSGLLVALEVERFDAAQIVDCALERGLLINAPRPSSLRFMPALTTRFEDTDLMIDILDASVRALQ